MLHVIDWALSSGRKRGFRVARCDTRKSQGVMSKLRKVRSASFAGCEVDVSHLAKFSNRRVQSSGVAPCDLFLIILRESGGKGKVDANVLEVSGTGLQTRRSLASTVQGWDFCYNTLT